MLTEEWKDVEGYEGLYKVSSHGKVFSYRRRRVMSPAIDAKDSRLRLLLCKNGERKGVYIHRLVAIAFLPNPENKPLVNHKDCDTRNNYIDNLEWATSLEDRRHAIKMGRMPSKKGAWGPNAKLSEDDVLAIRASLLEGVTPLELSEYYGVSRGHISNISSRRIWTDI